MARLRPVFTLTGAVRRHARILAVRGLVAAVVVGVVALVLWWTGAGTWLWELFSDRERIQRVVRGAGPLAPVVYVSLLVLQAVVAPLPAPVVAAAGGYCFGLWEGFLLTWLGALLGGVGCFWLSRAFGRGAVVATEPLSERLDRYAEAHGALLIFVLRLIPLISFDAISYGAGLSGIPFWKFVLATALGMAPGTFVFVYLGGASPGWGVWAALVVLAALAIVAYYAYFKLLGPKRGPT